MARFRFQLQALLDARQRVEDERRREVSELEAERHRLEEDLRRRQTSIVDAREEARDGLLGEVRPHLLRAAANASMSLMRDAQRSVLELAGLHRRLEAARAVLSEASKERRAIELVKERRFEAWKHEIERREQATLDELATNAGARRARERDALDDGVRETA